LLNLLRVTRGEVCWGLPTDDKEPGLGGRGRKGK